MNRIALLTIVYIVFLICSFTNSYRDTEPRYLRASDMTVEFNIEGADILTKPPKNLPPSVRTDLDDLLAARKELFKDDPVKLAQDEATIRDMFAHIKENQNSELVLAFK